MKNYVAEGLEDVAAVSHFRMSVLNNAFCQYCFLTYQRDSNTRPETAIGDMINSVQRLNDEVLEFISGDNSLC